MTSKRQRRASKRAARQSAGFHRTEHGSMVVARDASQPDDNYGTRGQRAWTVEDLVPENQPVTSASVFGSGISERNTVKVTRPDTKTSAGKRKTIGGDIVRRPANRSTTRKIGAPEPWVGTLFRL